MLDHGGIAFMVQCMTTPMTDGFFFGPNTTFVTQRVMKVGLTTQSKSQGGKPAARLIAPSESEEKSETTGPTNLTAGHRFCLFFAGSRRARRSQLLALEVRFVVQNNIQQ
jgi:hypothetical protein